MSDETRLPEPEIDLAVGQLRCLTRLGSRAVYRVCDWDDRLVNVEVVRAPGLAPGHRFSFTREAVRMMELVDGSDPPAAFVDPPEPPPSLASS